MEETNVQYWPPEVPETLWNYGLMQAQQQPVFPFMGLRVEPGFQWAFAAGFVFVAFFAWKRFNEKTFDSKSFGYRVLEELDLTALRGGAAMRRAYLIYAAVLLLLYVGLTFFGKLILETVGRLPIAGAQVDTGNLDFSSPQWPLMLAFGFAGLAPLIPPLRVAETWLRSRAHRAVGIPTRIDQLARRIIDNFERRYHQRRTTRPRGKAEPTLLAPAWVKDHFGSEAKTARIHDIYEELIQFSAWSEREDPDWPDRSVRVDLRRLERKVAAEANRMLQEYEVIMRSTPPQPAAEAVQAGEGKPKAGDQNLRNRLDDAVQRMTALRGDMAAIIAVYAEGDRDFSRIRKPEYADLKEALTETFAFMRVRSGPEMGLLIALVPVMLAYTIFCMLDLHPLLKPVQVTALSVAATAGLETLRFAAIFTVPALAAFAVRFYLLDQHSSDRHTRGEAPRLTSLERLAAILLGTMVAVVFLALVALLWAAVLSPTSVQFQLLLFRGDFLMYFVTQAGIAAVVLSVALPACDLTSPQSAWVRRGLGLFCAVAVLLYLLFYFGRWYNGLQCSVSGTPFIPGVLTEQICFRDNSAVDYLIYPIAAFLTCAVFGRLPKGTTAPAGAPRRRWRFGAGVAAGAAAAALLLAVAVALPAHSQDCGGESCEVKIGFRTDVEPFSYLVRTDDRPEFKGYLADLCYALFHGSAYQVKALAVTVTDRFRRIDGGAAPSEDPPVDMLCDPTTLRFSGVRQEVKGFYSPIVFVSGVTDLVRKSSDARTVAYIGFARNTTAKNVARKACEIDLLRIRDPGASPQPGECDPTMPAAKDFCASSGPAPALAPRGPAPSLAAAGPSDRPRYYFCPKDSHPELIEWFCRKNVDSTFELGFHMAYFGDREIIQGKLAAYQKEAGRECPGKYIEPDPTNYTYEPYALVVSAKRPALAQFVQRRVYEYFSHSGNPRGLFQTYFRGQQMSPALAYLYLLNGVMDQDTYAKETIYVSGPTGRWIDRLPCMAGRTKGCERAPAVAATSRPGPDTARREVSEPLPSAFHWPQRDMEAPGETMDWPLEGPRGLSTSPERRARGEGPFARSRG